MRRYRSVAGRDGRATSCDPSEEFTHTHGSLLNRLFGGGRGTLVALRTGLFRPAISPPKSHDRFPRQGFHAERDESGEPGAEGPAKLIWCVVSYVIWHGLGPPLPAHSIQGRCTLPSDEDPRILWWGEAHTTRLPFLLNSWTRCAA